MSSELDNSTRSVRRRASLLHPAEIALMLQERSKEEIERSVSVEGRSKSKPDDDFIKDMQRRRAARRDSVQSAPAMMDDKKGGSRSDQIGTTLQFGKREKESKKKKSSRSRTKKDKDSAPELMNRRDLIRWVQPGRSMKAVLAETAQSTHDNLEDSSSGALLWDFSFNNSTISREDFETRQYDSLVVRRRASTGFESEKNAQQSVNTSFPRRASTGVDTSGRQRRHLNAEFPHKACEESICRSDESLDAGTVFSDSVTTMSAGSKTLREFFVKQADSVRIIGNFVKQHIDDELLSLHSELIDTASMGAQSVKIPGPTSLDGDSRVGESDLESIQSLPINQG